MIWTAEDEARRELKERGSLWLTEDRLNKIVNDVKNEARRRVRHRDSIRQSDVLRGRRSCAQAEERIDIKGEKVEQPPEEQVEEKQAEWYEETWDKLRDSGLFRFLNIFLHIFGWAIQMEVGDDGKIEKVYPIRCKYDGFSEGDEKMMRKIGTFMKCDEWLRNNNDRRFSKNS